MSKRKTVGERIAAAMEAGHAISGAHVGDTARAIDSAIRRAQAKAWEEGYEDCYRREFGSSMETGNPYRGRARR